jgi:hypothetical protein
MNRLLWLDPQSRRIVRRFAFKLTLATGMGIAAAGRAVDPVAHFLLVFEVLCFFASVLAAVLAVALRDDARADRLSFWDETLAFGSLALLAHAAKTLFGQ